MIIHAAHRAGRKLSARPGGKAPKSPRSTLPGFPPPPSKPPGPFSSHLPETCGTSGLCTKIEETDEPDNMTTHCIPTPAQPGSPPKLFPTAIWWLAGLRSLFHRMVPRHAEQGEAQDDEIRRGSWMSEQVIGLKNVSSIPQTLPALNSIFFLGGGGGGHGPMQSLQNRAWPTSEASGRHAASRISNLLDYDTLWSMPAPHCPSESQYHLSGRQKEQTPFYAKRVCVKMMSNWLPDVTSPYLCTSQSDPPNSRGGWCRCAFVGDKTKPPSLASHDTGSLVTSQKRRPWHVSAAMSQRGKKITVSQTVSA